MIIIDTSIFLHANYHIISKYTHDIDEETLYEKTVAQILNIMAKKFPGEEFILALDGDNNFRKSFISNDYKANRGEPKFDKLFINSMFITSDFNVKLIDGLEADDIIYLLTLMYEHSVIISTDSDVKLMLDDATMYHYRLDKLITLTDRNLLVTRLLKICNGDVTDNVESIKLSRFGESFLNKVIDKLVKDKKPVNLKYVLDYLYTLDLIDNYNMNYDLVMYDLDTYDKYIPDFENKLKLLL